MHMSKREYEKFVRSLAPRSPIWKDLLNAFWIGGLICTLGQLIQNGWKAVGLNADAAGTATAVTLVLVSAVLTALSVYDNIAKIAGAGTLVPITGFANAVVSPAMEFKAEGFVTGMAAKMFSIAGPVLVFGTAAGVLYGLVYFLIRLVF